MKQYLMSLLTIYVAATFARAKTTLGMHIFNCTHSSCGVFLGGGFFFFPDQVYLQIKEAWEEEGNSTLAAEEVGG